MSGNIRTGIDIVDIKRINKLLIDRRESFFNRIFSLAEIKYINDNGNRTNTVAGMFSVKEAVSKLLGSGIGEIDWKDIEIYHENNGKPYIKLNKKIKDKLESINIRSIDISISHEREYAIAIAQGIGDFRCGYDLNIQIPNRIKNLLPNRKTDTHKGSYGRVGIIGGSRGMAGAIYLSSQAAIRSGSGLVYSLVPRTIEAIMSAKLTEVIVKSIEDEGKGYFIKASIKEILKTIEPMDVIGIGPGMGVDEDRLYIIEEIIKSYNNPIILDADAINCLSINPNTIYNRDKEIIITPHPGELGRLLGKSSEEIQENRTFYSKYVSEKYNIIVVLKGDNTVVACPGDENVYINTTGNPGMATAGSGDVLTGMICSFIGQGIRPLDATILGVFTHGLAGDLAKVEKGEYGLISSDIIEHIPKSIKKIQG